MRYGITERTTTTKKQRLDLWSGAWFSVNEGVAVQLPKSDGFMVTTYNGDKVRVVCPAPRTADNYREVDAALSDALTAHYASNGTAQVVTS